MVDVRFENDTLGQVAIAKAAYWGAQTQRAIGNFAIGSEKMPRAIISALGMQKLCAAQANAHLGLLQDDIAPAIIQAAQEVAQLKLYQYFPLTIWQSGSGTQTNMNANEVIANRAIEILKGEIGSKHPVHPNDHVNLGQSTNDTFPTIMHIATAIELKAKLMPALQLMSKVLETKQESFKDIIKIGRTHLQDAVPLSLGQVFSSYLAQITYYTNALTTITPHIYSLAQGATAVGTGLNTHPKFAQLFAEKISELTKIPFVSARNKFAAIAAHDALVALSGILNGLATAGIKIASDIRLLASGPRCGIGEIILPANEPGSSIMPGKVNPTQCEALIMVCVQVIGNHQTITTAATAGQLELNVSKPVIIYNILQSINLLADVLTSFTNKCVIGIQVNAKRIEQLLDQSLMLVTALNPKIGYDNAAKIAKLAYTEDLNLQEAALKLKLLTKEQFENWIDPRKMVFPNV